MGTFWNIQYVTVNFRYIWYFQMFLYKNNVIEQRCNVFDKWNRSFRNAVKVVNLNYICGRSVLVKVFMENKMLITQDLIHLSKFEDRYLISTHLYSHGCHLHARMLNNESVNLSEYIVWIYFWNRLSNNNSIYLPVTTIYLPKFYICILKTASEYNIDFL